MECGCSYDYLEGDPDERMCNFCLEDGYEENENEAG